MVEKYRFDLLTDTRTCYRYLQVGFSIIVITFFAGLGVLAVPGLQAPYDVLVMPSLFLGLGFLLLGVGTHLHIMHLNVVRMMDEKEHD